MVFAIVAHSALSAWQSTLRHWGAPLSAGAPLRGAAHRPRCLAAASRAAAAGDATSAAAAGGWDGHGRQHAARLGRRAVGYRAGGASVRGHPNGANRAPTQSLPLRLCECECCVVWLETSKKSTPLCSFFRPSCVQKTSLTNESEVSSPVTDLSALCAGGGAGRPKACCLLGRKNGSSVGAFALQASGRHRTTLVRDAHGCVCVCWSSVLESRRASGGVRIRGPNIHHCVRRTPSTKVACNGLIAVLVSLSPSRGGRRGDQDQCSRVHPTSSTKVACNGAVCCWFW